MVGWDYLAFSVFVLAVYGSQEMARHRVARDAAVQLKGDRELVALNRMLRAAAALVLAVCLIAGGLFVAHREEQTRAAEQDSLRGVGAVLAYELERFGHAAVSLDSPPDDPGYLAMIDTMVRWMELNPRIESIYTLRKRPDGANVFVLGPETDYNRDGRIDGAREERVPLGQVYPETIPELEKAFQGEPAFQNNPSEDSWGVSVSMFVPLRDAAGGVEAALGVDFSAEAWRAALAYERTVAMGGVFLIVLVLNSLHWLVYRVRLDPILQRRFNAELAESETRFRNFANHAPVLLQVADTAGGQVFFNQTWLDFTGKPLAEQYDDGWLALVHPEDRPFFAARLAAAFERRAAFRDEFRLRHADGGYRWVKAVYIPRWQGGSFTGYIGTCTDITEHKQLEEALQRQVAFEQFIATVSAKFVNLGPGDIDGVINDTLGAMGRFTGADRVYIYMFATNMTIACFKYGWHSSAARPIEEEQPVIDTGASSWLMTEFLNAGRLFVPRVAAIPAAAERALLEEAGIRSMVAVPMAYGDRLLGFLGMHSLREDKVWQEEDILLPKLVGEVIVGALQRCQAEAALEKSEERYKAIVDSVPDVLYHVSRDGLILDVKPVHRSSAAPDDVGKFIAALLPAHLVKPALDAVAYALDTGEVQVFEYYLQPDDRTAYFEARVTRAGADDALIIVRDISERRRSEACDLLLLDIAVKVLEERPLEDILSFACQHIAVIFGIRLLWVGRKEADGTVRLFAGSEEAAECLKGASVRWDDGPQGLGPTGTAIRTGKFQQVETDDARVLPWRDRLQRFGVTSGVAFPLKVGGLILGALTIFAAERALWTKRNIVHLTNFAEQIALAIYSTTNRQRLRLLTTGLEAAANAIVITDQSERIQWVNPAFCELTGLTAAAATAESIRILYAGAQSRSFYAGLWQRVLAGKAWHGEIAGRRRDGEIYAAEMTITPVRDEGGDIVNCIAIIQDVTQRRQAEREMLEAREAVARAERLSSLGIMAAGIAHEINQPLNSLKVTADSTLYWHRQGKTPGLAKIMENIEKVSRQADRIDSIIKHMRSFVRSSQCGELEPCDLSTAAEEAMSMLGAQLASHGIAVSVELAEGLPPVLANATQLEEVIINLLVNAMQSLDTTDRADKAVVLTTGRHKDEVFLEVSDNGPGISKKIKNKIFEPFFTTKPAGEGMGLGLSIVHSIVASYGGQISVKAPRRGEGVTFRIDFPACGDKDKGGMQA